MKYVLYRKRTFSEKFNLVFDWLRDNWRPLLFSSAVFLLPSALLQGLGPNWASVFADSIVTGNQNWGMYDSGMWQDLLYFIGLLSGPFLSFSLIFALIRRSFIDGEDLNALSLRKTWKAMTHNMGRLLWCGFCMGFVMWSVFLGGACLIGIFIHFPVICQMLLFVGALVFVFLLLLCLSFFPIYILDEYTDSLDAFQQSIRLCWKCFWGYLGTVCVMGCLSYALMGFSSLPVFFFAFLKSLVLSNWLGAPGPIIDVFSYLSSVFVSYVGYLGSLLLALAVTIQTGHAIDKVDGVSADGEIENF